MIHTGFNLGFRSLIIAVGVLATSFVARKRSDFNFTYGYCRFEIIAVFSACTCLYIMASFTCVEEIHHMLMNRNDFGHSDELTKRYDFAALTLKLISEVYVILKLWHCLD